MNSHGVRKKVSNLYYGWRMIGLVSALRVSMSSFPGLPRDGESRIENPKCDALGLAGEAEGSGDLRQLKLVQNPISRSPSCQGKISTGPIFRRSDPR